MILEETVQYITSAPYFGQTMAWIVACSMFVGATVYNGDVKKITKWVIATIPLIILQLATTIIRLHSVDIVTPWKAYAGLLTILIVSFYYLLGMFLGVVIVWVAIHVKLKEIFKIIISFIKSYWR